MKPKNDFIFVIEALRFINSNSEEVRFKWKGIETMRGVSYTAKIRRRFNITNKTAITSVEFLNNIGVIEFIKSKEKRTKYFRISEKGKKLLELFNKI